MSDERSPEKQIRDCFNAASHAQFDNDWTEADRLRDLAVKIAIEHDCLDALGDGIYRQRAEREMQEMGTKLEKVPEPQSQLARTPEQLTRDQIELIKRTMAEDFTDDELQLFIHQANRTGLDPLSKQIYAFKHKGKVNIAAHIDGLRLIAARTGRYAPGRPTEYEMSSTGGRLIAATAYVKTLVGGEWHECSETAYLQEYEGSQPIWKQKPRVMLAKCAEARALRRAFPAELSGIYGSEEMDQVTAGDPAQKPQQRPKRRRPTPPGAEPRTVEATATEVKPDPDDLPPWMDDGPPAAAADEQPKPSSPVQRSIDNARQRLEADHKQFDGLIMDYRESTGVSGNGKPWTNTRAKIQDPETGKAEWYGTFSETLGNMIIHATGTGEPVIVTWKTNERGYRDVVDLEIGE